MPKTTVNTEKQITVPTVHLNGTGADGLLEQYEAMYRAVNDAIREVRQHPPHGRDYYVQDGNAYTIARDEHIDRLKRLQSVADELLALHGAVLVQRVRR